MTYRVEIPGWRPTRDNLLCGKNRFAAHHRKKRDADTIARACDLIRVPRVAIPRAEKKQRKALGIGPLAGDPVPVKRRVHLEVCGPFFAKPPDRLAYWKSVLDALVTGGFLADDDERWCDFDRPVYRAQRHWHTTLTLEDLPS